MKLLVGFAVTSLIVALMIVGATPKKYSDRGFVCPLFGSESMPGCN